MTSEPWRGTLWSSMGTSKRHPPAGGVHEDRSNVIAEEPR